MNAAVLFGTWPYLAVALAVGGLVVRYFVDRARPGAADRAAAEGKIVFGGGRLWRVSLVFLLATHLLGLLLPRAVLAWNGVPLRLYVLEGSTFLLGGLAVGAWTELMWRHSTRRCASLTSAVADAVLLGFLFVALVSGLFMQALFRWGSSWGAATLTPYVVSLVHGRPAVQLVEQMPFLVRLHVVSTFGVVAAIPFSRVASILTVGIRRALASIGAPVSRGLGAFEARIRERAMQWIWPEEDTDPNFTPPTEWVPNQSGIVLSPGPTLSARNEPYTDEFHEPVRKAL
jgi:nitrate reductase gamma subunit